MNFRPCNITPRAAGGMESRSIGSPRGAAAVSTTSLDIERPRRLKHAAREIVKEKEGEMEALQVQKDAQVEALKKRNGQLEERLAALEQIVGRLARQ